MKCLSDKEYGELLDKAKYHDDALAERNMARAQALMYRRRWHESRRYLREANKGAERLNLVCRNQATRIGELLKVVDSLVEERDGPK